MNAKIDNEKIKASDLRPIACHPLIRGPGDFERVYRQREAECCGNCRWFSDRHWVCQNPDRVDNATLTPHCNNGNARPTDTCNAWEGGAE